MQAAMLAWIVTYLLHSTILVLGAWLLERRWGDRPERMSAVWKTALVGGLLTATMQTSLGIAPAAGHWDLSPELTASREPELTAGAEAVTAPTEALTAASAAAPVIVGSARVEAGVGLEASAEPSWPPTVAFVGRAGLEESAEPSWPPTGAIARSAGSEASPKPSWPPTLAFEAARVKPGLLDRETAPVLASASVEALPPSAPQAAEPSVSSSSSALSAAVPWVLAVLGLGGLLGLASVLVAFVALRQQLEGRRMVAEGLLPTLLEGLRRRAGVGRRVPLMVAPRVRVPMAVGVLRPEIVVPPQAAQSLPPAHQESLLAHELAHVLRHDPAWRLAALLVERVFFFQPLNRLASRRVAQSAEYLCDDWAARHTRQPLALASCLTEIATWVARPGPVATTMAGPRSILGRRVQRLLQPARASARPWWLGATLGLPLLGLVAVAPGVSTRAQAKGDRKAPERIVVIDQEGRRHELPTNEGGAIVVHERDGELVVRKLDHAAGAEPVLASGEELSPREARKAARAEERARDKVRQRARKDLRRAFRDAKARGDAAPSRAEVEAILRKARKVDGDEPSRRHPHPEAETMELHVMVPGELEVHGRVPVDADVLEALRALEGLEGLEELQMLEGLELEELGPMLEEIQEELEEAGIDVVLRRQDGAAEPQLRIMVSPDHEHAGHDAERARHHAERAREQGMHHAARAREEAVRHVERARRDAVREHLRGQQDHERGARDAEQLEREAEALRRQIERAHRERNRRSPSSDELPTVWYQRVAPPAPVAPEGWSFPVPAPSGELPMMSKQGVPVPMAPPAPPMMRKQGVPVPAAPTRVYRRRAPSPSARPGLAPTPRAPLPPAAPLWPGPAPTAPPAFEPDEGSVVWISWPPTTSAASVAHC